MEIIFSPQGPRVRSEILTAMWMWSNNRWGMNREEKQKIISLERKVLIGFVESTKTSRKKYRKVSSPHKKCGCAVCHWESLMDWLGADDYKKDFNLPQVTMFFGYFCHLQLWSSTLSHFTLYWLTWIRITCGYYVILRPALKKCKVKKKKGYLLNSCFHFFWLNTQMWNY